MAKVPVNPFELLGDDDGLEIVAKKPEPKVAAKAAAAPAKQAAAKPAVAKPKSTGVTPKPEAKAAGKVDQGRPNRPAGEQKPAGERRGGGAAGGERRGGAAAGGERRGGAAGGERRGGGAGGERRGGGAAGGERRGGGAAGGERRGAGERRGGGAAGERGGAAAGAAGGAAAGAERGGAGGDRRGGRPPRADRPPRAENAPVGNTPEEIEAEKQRIQEKRGTESRERHDKRGGRGGNSGGFDRQGKRDFERRSGTGRAPNENKKSGAGKGNWGKQGEEGEKKDDTQEAKAEGTVEKKDQQAYVEEAKKEEEEPPKLGLDDWEKLKKPLNIPLPPPRRPGEGEVLDEKWKQYIKLEKGAEEEATEQKPKPKAATSAPKKQLANDLLNLAPPVSEDKRGGRGRGGDNRRGGGAGAKQGRGGRAQGSKDNNLALNDVSFPPLG